MKRLLGTFIAGSLAASAVSEVAHAYEIQTLNVLRVDQGSLVAANAITGQVTLTNTTKQTLVLTPQPYRSGGALFQLDTQQEFLRPGESRSLRFSGQIGQAGKFEIDLPIAVRTERAKSAIDVFKVELYYLVSVDTSTNTLVARPSNYEELFLKLGARDIPGQGRVFDSIQDTGRFPKSDDYRNNQQPPMSRWPQKPDRSPSRAIPPGTGIGDRGLLRDEERDEPFQEMLHRWYESFPGGFPQREPALGWSGAESNNDAQENIRGAVTASGTFSYLGTDAALHPAWGWRVRAWTNVGGTWSKVAEDWVESDGRWTLAFNQPTGAQVQFQYVAFNQYFIPQTNEGETYRWVGPVRGALPSAHAEGSWIADTNTGNARGLGELYKDGYRLWSNLYWAANINPLRSAPIKVIFPNLTYKCGGDSVWSCANTAGNIWLIPSHGTNGQTMIHELGHQLNYEYWDNVRPDNSGGSHTIDGCFTSGLALLEGFANYMVGWTKTNRDTNAGMVRSLENPAEIDACTTTNLNEGYVGATFWDMHDKVVDGSDTLWFNARGAVPALYLNAGMKQKMSDYRETFRNAANVEHRTIIDGIFEMNNTK